MQGAAEFAVIVVIAIVACAIVFMWDAARNAGCPQCAHCRQKAWAQKQKKRDIQAEARAANHRAWHLSSGPDGCPYCAESSEGASPSEAHNKDKK